MIEFTCNDDCCHLMVIDVCVIFVRVNVFDRVCVFFSLMIDGIYSNDCRLFLVMIEMNPMKSIRLMIVDDEMNEISHLYLFLTMTFIEFLNVNSH